MRTETDLPLRVVIAEDERIARRALRAELERLDGVAVVAACDDGPSTVAAIERESPDALFLDIEMPGATGFDVVQSLHEDAPPAVVFVTAFGEHATRAFDVDAVDYVLKPITAERIAVAVGRVRRHVDHTQLTQRVQHLVESIGDGRPSYSRRLLIRQTGNAYFVPVDEVHWAEAVGNYVRLHTADRSHLLRGNLSELEARLDPSEFMRIHRSTVVNLSRIDHVEPYGGSDYQVVLIGGRTLRVSRSCRDKLLQDTH